MKLTQVNRAGYGGQIRLVQMIGCDKGNRFFDPVVIEDVLRLIQNHHATTIRISISASHPNLAIFRIKGASHFLVGLNRGERTARPAVLLLYDKAEASFAQLQTLPRGSVAPPNIEAPTWASRCHDTRSVLSGRSLLPLWRVGSQRCSLRGSIPATPKVRC